MCIPRSKILGPLRPKLTEILLKDKKESRRIYDGFMSQIQQKQIFKNLKFITKDTSLFWFQYRIAHRILGMNKYLCFSKITDSQT